MKQHVQRHGNGVFVNSRMPNWNEKSSVWKALAALL